MRLSIIGALLSLELVKATTWQVLVGSSSNYTDAVSYQPPWVFNKFYPNQLTIMEGDWVQFRFNSPESHQVVYTNNQTVSLMNSTTGLYSDVYSAYPMDSIDPDSANLTSINMNFSSGLRSYYDPDYWVQFNITGNFSYYCLVHLPYMVGYINVIGNSTGSMSNSTDTTSGGGTGGGTGDQGGTGSSSSQGGTSGDSGTGDVTGTDGTDNSGNSGNSSNSTGSGETITLTDRQVYMSSRAQIAQDIAITNNILTQNNLNVPVNNVTSGANGTIYNVWAGWGANITNGGYASSPRFYPAAMIINVGDSVMWDVSHDFMEAHIISFNGTGVVSFFPDDELMFSNGSVSTNPIYLTRNDNASITANYTFLNSGLLSAMPLAPGQPANPTWMVTFNETGLYRYVCALHVEAGMVGEILVVDPSWNNTNLNVGQVGPDTFMNLTSVRQTGLLNVDNQEKPRSKAFKRLRSVFGKPGI